MWFIFHSEKSRKSLKKLSPKMFSVSRVVDSSREQLVPFKTTGKDDKEEATVSVAAAQVLSELENISPLKEERY